MSLTEFLLARIAEDEAEADGFDRDWFDGGWSPAHVDRVKADSQAKRRIVELVQYADVHDMGDETVHLGVLTLLAVPYADHPDYREEWKP